VLTDCQLLALVAQGDQQALAELFRRHSAALYGFLFWFLGNSEDAADAVQETFLRVWQVANRFQGNTEAAVRFWLFRLGRNLAISGGRRGQTRRRHERQASASSDEDRSWQERCERSEWLLVLRECLQQVELTDQERQLLDLSRETGGDMTFQQLAEHLDSRTTTVWQQLQVVLERLRAWMRERGYLV